MKFIQRQNSVRTVSSLGVSGRQYSRGRDDPDRTQWGPGQSEVSLTAAARLGSLHPPVFTHGRAGRPLPAPRLHYTPQPGPAGSGHTQRSRYASVLTPPQLRRSASHAPLSPAPAPTSSYGVVTVQLRQKQAHTSAACRPPRQAQLLGAVSRRRQCRQPPPRPRRCRRQSRCSVRALRMWYLASWGSTSRCACRLYTSRATQNSASSSRKLTRFGKLMALPVGTAGSESERSGNDQLRPRRDQL